MNLTFNPVEEAAKRLGSQKAICDAMGVTKQVVSYWKKTGRVTGDINKFSDVTGIPRWMVRPDLYPPERERR